MNHIRPAWQSALKEWLSVLSRLQSISGQQRGHAIVRILVLVDHEGNPIIWTEPKMTKLEPVSRTGDFLEAMGRELE